MALVTRDFLQNECAVLLVGTHGVVTEAWGQGLMVGSVIVLLLVTIASMRRKVLLHKLILMELLMASIHGTFVFVKGPVYGWYTSSTAVLLYVSYNLHNIVNWIKIKPFLSKWASLTYIGTVALVFPYWVAEMYFNFLYNNDLGNDSFRKTRPWEPLCREPWWIFTSIYLLFIIKRSYACGVWKLVQTSTRFGVLIASMALSIAFIIADVIETVTGSYRCAGKNPYWKITLIWKCMADAVFLDDFKSVLDRLTARTLDGFGRGDIEASPSIALHEDNWNLVRSEGSRLTTLGNNRDSIPANSAGTRSLNGVRDSSLDTPKVASGSKDARTEHLETSALALNQPKRHTTKDWFDGIESD